MKEIGRMPLSDATTDSTTSGFLLKVQGTGWTCSPYTAVHLTVNYVTQITAYKSGTSRHLFI